jgi:hypothetical protein
VAAPTTSWRFSEAVEATADASSVVVDATSAALPAPSDLALAAGLPALVRGARGGTVLMGVRGVTGMSSSL